MRWYTCLQHSTDKPLRDPHANDHWSSVYSYGRTNKTLHFVCLYVSHLLIHNGGTFFRVWSLIILWDTTYAWLTVCYSTPQEHIWPLSQKVLWRAISLGNWQPSARRDFSFPLFRFSPIPVIHLHPSERTIRNEYKIVITYKTTRYADHWFIWFCR